MPKLLVQLSARGFFVAIVIALLLDPLSRFANKIARGETEEGEDKFVRASTNIGFRKLITMVLWVLPLILLFDYCQYGVDPSTLEAFIKWEAFVLAIITLAQYLTHIL